MGIFNNIINKINPQKIFDTTAKGIDNLAFTEEEKSTMRKEIWNAQLEFSKAQANANTISSKARRTLAFMIAVPYLGAKVLATILVMLGEFDKATAMNETSMGLAGYFGGVMTFYFGTYLYQKVKSKK